VINNIPTNILAFSLILLPVTYFLAPKATVSFFPSYLIGLSGLIAIFQQGTTLYPIKNSLVLLSLLLLSFLVSNHLAGYEISVTAKYFGYTLLILTFVVGFYVAADKLAWFLTAFMTVTVGAAVISSLFSIGFYFFLDYQPLVENRLYGLGRLSNPVISALSYGAVFCLCITAIATSKESGLRALIGCVAIILLLAILLTGTRGAWIGIFAALLGTTLIRPWRNRSQLIASLCVVSIFPILIVTLLYFSGYGDAIFKRSFSFRPEIWSSTLEAWKSGSLFFGSGLHSTIDLTIPPNKFMHPHSIYLSTLYYGGMLSLTLLLMFFARILWLQLKQADTEYQALPLLVFGLATLLFDGNRLIEKVNFLWLCLWLPVAIALVSEGRANSRESRESGL
jgi:O-antigen ligase